MRVIADFANSLACPTPKMFSGGGAVVQGRVGLPRRRLRIRGGLPVIEAMAGLPTPKK